MGAVKLLLVVVLVGYEVVNGTGRSAVYSCSIARVGLGRRETRT